MRFNLNKVSVTIEKTREGILLNLPQFEQFEFSFHFKEIQEF